MSTHIRLPLHHRLFLIAHDLEGNAYVHPQALGLGLAGAVIADLVLTEHLRIRDGAFVTFTCDTPPADPLLASVWQAMHAAHGNRDVTHWLRTMTTNIHDRTSGGLLASGAVTPVTRRSWLGSGDVRYRHTDRHLATELLSAVRYATHQRQYPAPTTLTMCGFVAVLRLHNLLHLNEPGTETLAQLHHLLQLTDVQIQYVVATVGTLIGDAAISAYR